MDVLVLGGSVFVGRAVVSEARASGARVIVFNRGVSGVQPSGVEHIVGDRTSSHDLEQLAGRTFDLVIDTCGCVPDDVTRSAQLLAPRCGHYAFVSTINVFPGWPEEADHHAKGVYESSPDATRDDAPDDDSSYGWLKAGCELAAVRAFGDDHVTVLRAGCIVGPDDSSVGRLPWWIDRIARGGEVLAPGDQEDVVSLLDSRDLARFALEAAPGAFEVCGPPVSRASLLADCRVVTRSDAQLTWVDDAWLSAQDVEPWTEIPLWLPHDQAPSAFAHDTADAEKAGLQLRPVEQTVADTWAWQHAVAGGWRPGKRTPGLDPAKEATLLESWHATR